MKGLGGMLAARGEEKTAGKMPAGRKTEGWKPSARESWARESLARGGFTVLELLVAVVLMAILAAVLTFDMVADADRAALEAAGQRLRHTVRYAQLLAGEHHLDTTLELDLEKGEYWLTVRPTGPRVGEPAGTERTGAERGEAREEARRVVEDYLSRPGRLGENLQLTRVRVGEEAVQTGGQARVRFRPDGSADAAVIELRAGQRFASLRVDRWTSRAHLRQGRLEDGGPGETKTGG